MPAAQRSLARIPPFHTVPSRLRSDGWTPLKQAEFIGHLAETGNVRKAAERVGMARETAYRLRAREGAESFIAAWNAALARGRGRPAPPPPGPVTPGSRKVTLAQLMWRMETGIWRVRLHGPRYVGVVQKPDNSAVFELLGRTGRSRLTARSEDV